MSMEYVEAAQYESYGSKESCGVKILIAAGRELNGNDKVVLSQKAQDIYRAVMAETARLDPERAAAARAERDSILALFDAPIFVEEIPNGYCSDWCCKHLPWFVVTTPRGRIKIGWRKRVIEINWDDSRIDKPATHLFPNEDVTKGAGMIHAWGYDKAREYIRVLMQA